MSKNFYKAGRLWLNKIDNGDTGAIHWGVLVDGECPSNIQCALNIWDCGKKVVLNFDAYSDSAAKDRADKLNKLINELTKMQSALAEAYTKVEWDCDEDIAY